MELLIYPIIFFIAKGFSLPRPGQVPSSRLAETVASAGNGEEYHV
jgi:hypothetical protein